MSDSKFCMIFWMIDLLTCVINITPPSEGAVSGHAVLSHDAAYFHLMENRRTSSIYHRVV